MTWCYFLIAYWVHASCVFALLYLSLSSLCVENVSHICNNAGLLSFESSKERVVCTFESAYKTVWVGFCGQFEMVARSNNYDFNPNWPWWLIQTRFSSLYFFGSHHQFNVLFVLDLTKIGSNFVSIKCGFAFRIFTKRLQKTSVQYVYWLHVKFNWKIHFNWKCFWKFKMTFCF